MAAPLEAEVVATARRVDAAAPTLEAALAEESAHKAVQEWAGEVVTHLKAVEAGVGAASVPRAAATAGASTIAPREASSRAPGAASTVTPVRSSISESLRTPAPAPLLLPSLATPAASSAAGSFSALGSSGSSTDLRPGGITAASAPAAKIVRAGGGVRDVDAATTPIGVPGATGGNASPAPAPAAAAAPMSVAALIHSAYRVAEGLGPHASGGGDASSASLLSPPRGAASARAPSSLAALMSGAGAAFSPYAALRR
jgi:hypothetical protein